jgi:hypothetical protein
MFNQPCIIQSVDVAEFESWYRFILLSALTVMLNASRFISLPRGA